MLQAADAESRRFGLNTGRTTLAADFDPQALREAIIAAQLDLVIVRLRAEAGSPAARIDQVGFWPLHTDTLVTYSCALSKLAQAPQVSVGLDITMAQPGDAAQIEALVRDIFATYPNHYTANPALSRQLALDGYVEWALSHLDDPLKHCFVVRVDGQFAGFAATRHDPDGKVATGVLFGVSPAFSGRGLYTDFVRATLAHYREAGYLEMRNATQLGNLAVQRVWLREQFKLDQTEHTWHLLPMLGQTVAATSQTLDLAVPEQLHALLLGAAPASARAQVVFGRTVVSPASVRLHESRRTLEDSTACTTRVVLDSDGQLLGWSQLRG